MKLDLSGTGAASGGAQRNMAKARCDGRRGDGKSLGHKRNDLEVRGDMQIKGAQAVAFSQDEASKVAHASLLLDQSKVLGLNHLDVSGTGSHVGWVFFRIENRWPAPTDCQEIRIGHAHPVDRRLSSGFPGP